MLAIAWKGPGGTSAAVLLLSLLAAAPIAAQGDEARLEKDIAVKAKAVKLDTKHAKSAQINGKKFNLIPADFSSIKSLGDIKAGVVLGQLDTEASTAEDVSLPPGKYDLYLAQEGGVWKAWATKNGKIVKAAKQVEERPDTPPNMEPQFSRGSGCWWVWLLFTGFNVCW
jgi:hypothetical protein